MEALVRLYGLRNPPDALLVHRHLTRNLIVRCTIDVSKVVHDQTGVDRVAPKLLVLVDGGDLLRRAVHLDVAVELAVWLEQHNVEALDAALLLHPSADAQCVVEDFEPAFLTARNRGSPADEQHSVSHA